MKKVTKIIKINSKTTNCCFKYNDISATSSALNIMDQDS